MRSGYMYSKVQLFMLGGLVSGVYAFALWLFLFNPIWFLSAGFVCTVYFFIVLFLALVCNLIGVKFKDL